MLLAVRTCRSPPEKASIPHASDPGRLLRLDLGEVLHAPQLGEEPGPHRDDRQRRAAARQDGRYGAEPRGHRAGPEVAELVGGSDEERVHRAHASAHLVRCTTLERTNTLIMSAAPMSASMPREKKRFF